MTLVAGVDSSTQSCKVVIRDLETGVLVREGRASHPNGTEVNPSAWWAALNEAITQAGGLDDVSAISIGGQQHGMVVLDTDGKVIRDALLWNDTRSAEQANDIVAKFGAEGIADLTGSLPVASFTSTKLLWLKQNEPENAAKVAAVCLPHDWLTWRLAGYGPATESSLGPDLSALTTDASDASGTGYFNPKSGEYVNEVLGFVLGHIPTTPRIVKANQAAHSMFFQNGSTLSIGAGAGDNAAAAFGVLAKAGDVVVSLGTSGTVFAVSKTATNDSTGTIAGFASASSDFLPLVCTLNAARVLDSMSAMLGVDHNELGQLALQSTPGAEGVVLVPYFEGERTPNLPDAKAGLHGLTLKNNTRANIARAAIEGMLCGLAAGLQALEAAGVNTERVILVGGAAANPAVQQIAAEVFGAPITVPAPGEYVANGAARQAASILLGSAPDWKIETLAQIPTSGQGPALAQYKTYADGYLG
jgi:xylulokinase